MTQPNHEVPDGVLYPEEILFVESLSEIATLGAVRPEEESEELTQFVEDSVIFMFSGIKGVGENVQPAEVIVAMPMEAVLFIIATAMRRVSEQPPEEDTGLIIPGQ